MKPRRRNGLRNALIALVLVFAGATAFLRSRFAWDKSCELAREQLPRLTGLQVELGRCEIAPLTQTVTLHEVAFREQGAAQPLFTSARLEMSIGTLQPFFGEVELSRLTVVSPRIHLDLTRAPKPGPAGPAGPPTCALETLRRVEIEKLEVTDAQLTVDAGASGGIELSGVDLHWRVRRGVAEFKLDAEQGGVRLGRSRGELAISKLQLEGGLDPEEELLELANGELGMEDVTLTASGRIEQLCNPSLFLDGQLFLPVKTLAKAANYKDQASGHLWGRASLSGSPRDPIVTVDVVANQLQWGRYQPGDFTARALLQGSELTIPELRIPTGEGEAKIAASLRLGGTFPVKARVEADRALFGSMLARAGLPGAWVNFAATGKGSVTGNLVPFQLGGDFDFAVADFLVASRPWDAPSTEGRELLRFARGRVGGPVRIFPDRAELPALKVESGNSRAEAAVTLHYHPDRGLQVAGTASTLDLSDFGAIAELPLQGTGGGTFEVRGPYKALEIASALSLRDFEFWDVAFGVLQAKVRYAEKVLSFPALTGQKGKSQYFGSAEVRFGEPLRLRLEASFPRGRTEDLVGMLAGVTSAVGVLEGDVEGIAAGRVLLEGPAQELRGSADVELANTLYFGRRVGDGNVRVRFVENRAIEQRIALTGPLGALRLDGTFWMAGPLAFKFSGEQLSLPELIGPERAREYQADGTLTLSGRIEGDSTVPVVTGYLTSPKIQFAGKGLGELHLEARMQGKKLQVFGKPFADARGFLELEAKAPYPYQGTASLSLPEIRPLLPEGAISQGVSGVLAGQLRFKGELRDRQTLELAANIDKLRLSRGDFSGQNQGPVQLSYARGRLAVDALTFKGPNTELTAQGFAGPRDLDLKMHGTADMRLLESFSPLLERTAGRLDLVASAQGQVDDPRLTGTAEFEDLRLQLRDQPVALRGLSGRVKFTESKVLFEDVHGILNEGRVALSGGLEHAALAVRTVDAHAQLDEVQLRFNEDLPFTTSGELHLYGRRDSPHGLTLAGDLDLTRLKYDRPLELSLVRDLARTRTLPLPSEERPKKWLSFDVGVHLKDVRVENNLAKGRLFGDLRLTGDNLKPGVLGTINAAEGSQAYYLRNQFAISQALVEFKSRDSIQGIFDMHAETQVREYLVKLHAFGRTSDPKVILTAEPDLPEADILTLLTFGVTSRDRTDTANAALNAGTLAADAFIAASGLDKEVQRFLPKFLGLRDLKFHISTSYDPTTGGMEPSAQFETRWLTDDIKLGVNQPIARGSRSVYVESQLSDRLSLQFQWDDEHRAETGVGNVGFDFKWRWEVE